MSKSRIKQNIGLFNKQFIGVLDIPIVGCSTIQAPKFVLDIHNI